MPAQAATKQKENEEDSLPTIEALKDYDSSRDAASKKVIGLGNWLDNFFANDRVYDEDQGSYIKLNLLQTYFQHDKPVYDAQIKAKIDVPKTQKKLQIFVESIDSDEEDSDQVTIDETVEKQEQSIGVRFLNLDSKKWKVTTLAGVRFRSGLDLFTRLRIRRLTHRDGWTFRLTENLFWFDSEGAGESTQYDADYRLTESLLFRSRSEATWWNKNSYFDLEQDFILFQNINRRKSLAYQVGARGFYNKGHTLSNYFVSVRYRQLMHRSWLFLDVIPMINHPEEIDYKPIRSITFNIEIVFDAK